jgi:hypothetical protein
MSREGLFRLSCYVNLALSTLCLAYASTALLVEAAVFYPALGLLLVVAYLSEHKYRMPVPLANLAGATIFVVWGFWVVVSYSRSGGQSDIPETLRWAMPYAGPFLGLLLLAKLFRDKKRSDYWMLYLLGLIQVVLACVLALASRLDRDAPLFPLFLLIYVLGSIWTLRTFALFGDSIPDAPVRRPLARNAPTVQLHRLGVLQSVVWFFVVLVPGLIVFFSIPRTMEDAFGGSAAVRPQTGFTAELDLAGTGPIELNDDLVFRMHVQDAQGNLVRISSDQRWRGTTLVDYTASGRWLRLPRAYFGFESRADRGTNSLYLEYEVVPASVRGIALASPTNDSAEWLRSSMEVPLFLMEPYELMNSQPRVRLIVDNPRDRHTIHFNHSPEEGAAIVSMQRRVRNLRYRQIISRELVDRTQWWQTFTPEWIQLGSYLNRLRQIPEPLRDSKIVANLAEAILKKAGLEGKQREPNWAERAAKALEAHLATSGEYSYTLNRPRQDMEIDPTEDFLKNTKQGHCELFASAMALMLRSQGIPARIVIGYRGSNWNGTGGFYEVKQYHAHTWVEAVVERLTYQPGERPEFPGGGARLRWLTLDATPSTDAAELGATPTLWSENISFARYLWEFFILDFSGSGEAQRQRLAEKFNYLIGQPFQRWWAGQNWVSLTAYGIAMAISLVAAGYGLYRWRRLWIARHRPELLKVTPGVPFYSRLLGLLARLRIAAPKPTQTPAEFGMHAADELRQRPAGAELAAIPPRIVEDYYAVRYGNAELDESQRQRIDQDLAHLEKAK